MKPAIFLTVMRGIETFAQGLLEHGDVELISMYETTYPLLDANGIPYRKFSDFYSEEHKTWAANEAGVRAAAIATALQGPDMRRQWPQYAGDPQTWEQLDQEVTQLLRRDFFEQMVYLDAFRRCARATDLRLVIVQQDIARDTRTLITTAHRLGIPSLHVLHGFPNGATNMHDECHADVVAVYSERSKKIFESFGMPPDRIHITGNPEWDKHARPPAPNFRLDACKMMGLNPSQPVITYAVTYTHRFSRISATTLDYVKQISAVILQAFAELSRRYPEWQFVLRPHPHDMLGPNTLREQARAAGLERVWVDDQKTTPLLAVTVADVMVCTQSNLGIEAILAGKPVVNVVIDEFGHDVYYEGLGPLFLDEDAVLPVRTVEEVAPSVEAAVIDPATRQRLLDARPGTIERFHYRLDGKATERFCALAIEVAERYTDFVAPVSRYPEFETLLARAVPLQARHVLAVGRAAKHVADTIRSDRHGIDVKESALIAPLPVGPFDVVVFSDPIPHSDDADTWLTGAVRILGCGGVVVAPFRHGGNIDAADAISQMAWAPPLPGMATTSNVGEYSRNGVDLVLSRCELEPVEVLELRNAALTPAALAENPSLLRCETDGWVICAKPREPLAPSEVAESST